MERLTWKDDLGYGYASMADSISYSFVGTFFMFFATTVAGVRPAVAGLMTAIGAIWNALYNPFMGILSDGLFTRRGRRRPFLRAMIIPLPLALVLLFTNMPLPEPLKSLYYGMMLMIFWVCYTTFFVPYLALGVDYTNNYDDRTVLRLWASFFNMRGNIVCVAVPPNLVAYLTARGATPSLAWMAVAGVMGLVSGITILLTYLASKRKDPPCPELRRPKLPGIRQLFAAYLSILKLPPVRWLVLASICALVCYSMIMSDMVYFMTYNLRLPSVKLSALLLGRPIIGLPLLWIVGKVALAIDKRQTLILFFLTGFTGMVILRLTPAGSLVWLLFYLQMLAFCTCVYWDLVPSIYFDICEYDKFTTGQDRESMIVSLQGLVEAAALGFGSFLLGTILDLAGFDGTHTVQPESALTWVAHCTTVLPAFFLVLASLAIWKYPISRDVHAEIVKKLAEREKR